MADKDDCRQGCKEEGAEMSDIPAFPVSFKWDKELSQYNGMTLRDYFAAKFIHPAFEDGNFLFDKEDYKKLANICYEMADAMLKARES